MNKKSLFPFCFAISMLLASTLCAYTYNKKTVGPLSVDIPEPEIMRQADTPLSVKTLLKNAGEKPLSVKLTYSTIETIEFEGSGKTLVRTVEVPAKDETVVTVSVVGRPGTLTAHYPIHLLAEWGSGDEERAAVVQPFESTIAPNPNWPTNNPMLGKKVEKTAELPLNTIPDGAGLALTDLTTYRAFWNLDKEGKQDQCAPLHFESVGWQGGNKDFGAGVNRQSMVRGGVSRPSLNMHPPYRQGPGNVGVDYRIKLPETKPITFFCYGAMRDVDTTKDKPTDGVTFFLFAESMADHKISAMEKHIVGTDWEPVEFDLSEFAGKEIQLRLVSDPGPKRDTTCDSCYWGDPMIFAGEKPLFVDPEALKKRQDELHKECVTAMKTGKAETRKTKIVELDGGQRAVVTMGDYGFLDGKIALGTPEKFVVYNGVRVSVKDQPIAAWPTTLAAGPWEQDLLTAASSGKNDWQWKQKIETGNETATMNYRLTAAGTALRLSVDCSEKTWISAIQFGPTDQAVDKVYYGHGYCVSNPKRFDVGADGHRLSTSHVGFDYPNGLSVLHASTMAPSHLTVDPERNIATMVVRPGTTLTLLPGEKGIFDCAVRYRAINPKKAAPGVKTKLGRFCFDLWWGKYKRHDEVVENAIRYGLTDSLVIIHGWQRYGYDNRLPDIWPPDTRPGTLAEMQETLEKCDAAGMLYGLHDNYIDFYPDADGFNFDDISFEKNGQPRKAWINKGINARSYQFRPDRFMSYLERNFDLMCPDLPQSCYFVDVFSSIAPPDFYDRQGNFHSRAESIDCWGKGFDVIRDRLTEVSRPRQLPFNRYSALKREEFFAPSISESGNDFLIGHLDGADCQFGRLSSTPVAFVSVVPCEDWERVPWFDAVNHTTFSLHGAGYSGRYEGGLGRLLHGIESDDYMTTEMMTGHPPMVDMGCATRGAVRKYWLMQPTLRELADCEIESVEFVGGDIHRMKIDWKSPDGKRKTTVWINRGQTDWKLALDVYGVETTLPAFGFWAKGPAGVAAIFRSRDGKVVEAAAGKASYVNGRQQTVEGLLPIRVRMKEESFKRLEAGHFGGELLWTAEAGTPQDYSVFIHLVPVDTNQAVGNPEKIVGVLGVNNPKPTTQWEGEIVTPMRPAAIPNDAPAGQYRLLAGLYSSSDGHRAHLIGSDNDNARYRLGVLTVVRDKDGKLSDLKFEEEKPKQDFEAKLAERIVPNTKPTDFTHIRTNGAFLLEGFDDRAVLTPLPDEKGTSVEVLWDKPTAAVVAEDADGKPIRELRATVKNGRVSFTTKKGEFRYVIKEL